MYQRCLTMSCIEISKIKSRSFVVPAFGLLIGKIFALTISSKRGIFENRERAYPKIHSFSIRFRKLEDVDKVM